MQADARRVPVRPVSDRECRIAPAAARARTQMRRDADGLWRSAGNCATAVAARRREP
jgi:hypothetical protein